jgi:hypothetical protein
MTTIDRFTCVQFSFNTEDVKIGREEAKKCDVKKIVDIAFIMDDKRIEVTLDQLVKFLNDTTN